MSLKKIFTAIAGTREDRAAYKSLIRAVKDNDAAGVAKVIDNGFAPDKAVGLMWKHPLEVALESDALDAFKTLLDKGADPNATARPGGISGAGTSYSLLCQSMAAGKTDFAHTLLDDPRTDVRKGGRIVMPVTHYPSPGGGVMELPGPLELARDKGYDDLAARIQERMKTQPAKRPGPKAG